jgi:hypothetical protein
MLAVAELSDVDAALAALPHAAARALLDVQLEYRLTSGQVELEAGAVAGEVGGGGAPSLQGRGHQHISGGEQCAELREARLLHRWHVQRANDAVLVGWVSFCHRTLNQWVS